MNPIRGAARIDGLAVVATSEPCWPGAGGMGAGAGSQVKRCGYAPMKTAPAGAVASPQKRVHSGTTSTLSAAYSFRRL